MGKKIIVILMFCFVFISILHSKEAPFPKLTGNYGVGQVEWTFIDYKRSEPITDDNNPCLDSISERAIPAIIYYPIKKKTGNAKAKYLPNSLIQALGLTGTGINELSKRSIVNADLSQMKAKYPVIIFSPGLGIASSFYTAILEEVASYGYIIFALSHPFMSGEIYNPVKDCVINFKPVPTEHEKIAKWLGEMIPVNLDDFDFVISELEKINTNPKSGIFENKFLTRLDLDNIVMMGHSGGGMSVTEYCSLELDKCHAAINLDGGNYTGIGIEISSAWPLEDRNLKYLKMHSASFPGADIIPNELFGENQYLVDIKRIDHQTFSDKAFFGMVNTKTPLGEDVIAPFLSHKLMMDYMLAFLDYSTNPLVKEVNWPIYNDGLDQYINLKQKQ